MTETPTNRPVRADLGRPETPEEEAARRAENSRLHRQRQNLRNLVAALAVCGLVVLIMVLVVPRNDQPRDFSVDYQQVAAEAQPDTDVPLAAPHVPEDWRANAAELRTGQDDVTEWYIGFIRYEGEQPRGYIGMSQGINANPTWAIQKLTGRTETGQLMLGGVQWREFDSTQLSPEDAGNTRYSLIGEVNGSLYVLYGSHEPEDVRLLAERIATGD